MNIGNKHHNASRTVPADPVLVSDTFDSSDASTPRADLKNNVTFDTDTNIP